MSRRRLIMITLAALTVVALVTLSVLALVTVDREVTTRRSAQHAADIRLCQVAVNGQNARITRFLAALSAAEPVPANPQEKIYQQTYRQLVLRSFGPINCTTFVATGRQVPATP